LNLIVNAAKVTETSEISFLNNFRTVNADTIEKIKIGVSDFTFINTP